MTTPETNPWLTIALLLGGAVLFAVVPLALARVWAGTFAPAKPGPEKNAIYECGLESTGDAWLRLKPEYYVCGIVFLVFDVEAVFLFPFAAAFPRLPWGAFAALVVFLLLLVEGLVWAWRKGILDWRQTGVRSTPRSAQ